MKINVYGSEGCLEKGVNEIVDWIADKIYDRDFKNLEEFHDIEQELINDACAALKWHSVPDGLGLVSEVVDEQT